MPLVPALGKQADLEFEASLVYRVSSRKTRVTQTNPVLKTKGKKKKKKCQVFDSTLFCLVPVLPVNQIYTYVQVCACMCRCVHACAGVCMYPQRLEGCMCHPLDLKY